MRPHIIGRQIVELRVSGARDIRSVQDRVGALCREELPRLMDEHFGMLPDGMLKLGRLELDLGAIRFEDLEQELVSRLDSELALCLENILQTQEQPATARDAAGPGSPGGDAALIAYFLQNGILPWWAEAASQDLLLAAFSQMLRTEHAVLHRMLQSVLRDDKQLARLVYACPDDLLERLLGLFATGDTIALRPVERSMQRSFGTGVAAGAWRAAWWQALFRIVPDVCSGSGPIDVESVVALVAGALQTSLGKAPDVQPVSANPATTSLLAHLFGQGESEPGLRSPGESSEAPSGADPEAHSQHPAAGGNEPRYDSHHTVRGAAPDVTELILQLENLVPEFADMPAKDHALTAVAGRLKDAIDDLRRMQENIGAVPGRIAVVLSIVRPLLAAVSKQLEEIDPHARPGVATVNALRDIHHALAAAVHSMASAQQQERALIFPPDDPRAGLQESMPVPEGTYYSAFSETDKILIRNAGLILLGPFLPRFFANLGLSSDGAFVHADASIRACLMLQYLVAGTAEGCFEAQLPLNKILCGIDLAEPLQAAWEILPEEAAAAEAFLEAVIQNGPLWKTLSVDGFRRAYLQRDALLSARDGHWLLQVARETHDIIIDRLPWTIQHLKLPWMEGLLVTEWQRA